MELDLDIIETMRVKPKPVKQSQHAADWARVKADYPDHADLITALAHGFGKPSRVLVKAGGETIMDSRRYE